MDIDIYQQCPCHSNKKIKFCCGKDVIGELNNVLAKNSAGQPAAALDLLERTIKKSGPRDCLLTLQTHILISVGELEKARQSNDLFLQNCPGHTTGYHHLALILLAEEKIDEAVEALQDAMDAIVGNEIPISLANAFRMVGVGLFAQGKTIASRAHLTYALALKGESDMELAKLIHETMMSPNLPLVLKQEFPLDPAPEGVEWEKKYVNVIRAMDRGQFRKGLKFLRKINESFPDQPEVLRATAVVLGYLGRHEEMVEAWRAYSRLEQVQMIESVEAEGIAQLFSDEPVSNSVSIQRLTYEVTETDGVSEAALSNPRLASVPTVEVDPFDEGPAPRFTFLVLDKDKVATAQELTLDNAPKVIAEALIYGKQTDRAARIEAVVTNDHRLEELKKIVQETFAGFANDEPTAQELGESNAMSELLEWRWHLPEGVQRQDHSDMVNEYRKHLMLNEWTELSLPVLQGKTPLEAAQDPEFKCAVQALILMLENATQGQYFNDDLGSEIRAKLGLDDIADYEVAESARVSSPILQQYLVAEKLSDEQLVQIQTDAMKVGNFRVLKKIIDEALSRPDFDGIPRELSYSLMSHFTSDTEEALGYLDKARESAKENGRPEGIYYVQEFELRLSRGMTDGLNEILHTIQSNYLDDPEVEYQLVRVLDRFGIGPDRGPIRGGPQSGGPQTAPPPGASGSGIWTPDQPDPVPADTSPNAPASEEKSSGLWIPD